MIRYYYYYYYYYYGTILTTFTESAVKNTTHLASFLAEWMVTWRSNTVWDTRKLVFPCSTMFPLWSTFKIEEAVTSPKRRPVGAIKYRFSSLSSPVARTCKEIKNEKNFSIIFLSFLIYNNNTPYSQ